MASMLNDNGTLQVDPEEEIPMRSIVVSVFFAITAILGISGNGLVLVVVAKVPDLRSITNILIGHQSFVDFISSTLLLLTFFPPTIDLTYLSESNHAFAVLVCKLWVDGFIYWAVIKVSTVNLVFLTLERFFAVVYPHAYRQRASRWKALLVCLLAWVIGPLSELYFLFTFVLSDAGECTKRSLTRGGEFAIAIMVFTFTLIIPLSIMSYVYIVIIRALKPVKPIQEAGSNIELARSTTSIQDMNNVPTAPSISKHVTIQAAETSTASNGKEEPHRNGQVQQHRNKTHAMKTVRERARRNVLVTMFLVSLTYAICWTPNQVVYFYYNLVSQTNFTGSFYLFTVILAGTNVCVNPIIYAFKYRKFQQGLRQVFLRKAPVQWETTNTASS